MKYNLACCSNSNKMHTQKLTFKRFNHLFVPRASFPKYRIPLSEFKGHQNKAFARMRQLLPQINLLLELRDSRAPLSTRNVLFDHLVHHYHCPRLILYSKRDISPQSSLATLARWHSRDEFMLIDCRNQNDVKALRTVLRAKYNTYTSSNTTALPLGFCVLIAGMPNLGKSTLLNSLRALGSYRNTKVAATGALPGVTKKTSEAVRIDDYCSGIYIYDTPGITLPARFTCQQRVLAQALAGCVSSSLIDPMIQADYLLYLINLQLPHPLAYTNYTNGKPTNYIDHVIRGLLRSHSLSGEIGAAVHWVSSYRYPRGCIKPVSFDIETLLPPSAFNYHAFISSQLRLTDSYFRSISLPRSLKRSEALAKNSNQLFRR